jgi:hypothetical protein
LFNLKKKVKNKAHVEASICEAYIVKEISKFISYYFEPHLRTRINRSESMELFVETHVRSQDRKKGAQQLIDNHAQHFVLCLFNNGHIICFLDSKRKLIIPSPGIVICKSETLKIN